MDSINLAKNIIEKSQNILIYPSKELQGDNLGSALALFYTLKDLGKNANINAENIPEKFRFLAAPSASDSGEFVISVNTDGKEISQMRYEKSHKDLKIYLSLNKGKIQNNDISFEPFSDKESDAGNYDLLITLGVQSLESVPQKFWKLPILNIDNLAQNENFGEVNLIEMTSSLAEIATNLIKSWEKEELFTKEIATSLLCGIVWASQNFRNPKTRPKTFETSAFLIEKGANHQEIIQRLYKQKTVSQIKLLGKVLENLHFHEEKEIYSANIKESEFKESESTSKDLAFVLEELKFHFRYLPNLLILWESHASPPITKGIFYSIHEGLVKKIMENFESAAKNNGALFLVREINLDVAREQVLNIL